MISKVSSAHSDDGQPTMLVFGHSHTHAMQVAVEKRLRKGVGAPLGVFRALDEKGGKGTGDTRFADFLALAAQLRPKDIVLSMIGGSQHAAFSTIQHPRRFDFYPLTSGRRDRGDVEIIPRRAIRDAVEAAIQKSDGGMLKVLRESTAARIVHLVPPPPKADNAYILHNHENLFAASGIASLGVSQPELRLKFWELQVEILQAFCRKRSIEVVLPPAKTTEKGFLRPEYYGRDSTHANWRYAETLLRSLEKRFLSCPS
jgi:hypothetical protein